MIVRTEKQQKRDEALGVAHVELPEGTYNLLLLTEELFDRFPEWVLDGMTLVTIQETAEGRVLIRYPIVTRETSILAQAEKHNYRGKSRNQERTERHAADRATALAKLRALGFTDNELEALL